MKGRRAVIGWVLALLLVVGLGAPQVMGADPGPDAAQRQDLVVSSGSAGMAALPGNAFTYQGYLTDNGSPASGLYDFAFSLYADLAGSQWVASALSVDNAQVTDGLFTVPVDVTDATYGDVHFYLNGEARYLRIGVRPGASTGSYTWLTPLQALTPVPYAQALPGLHTIQNATSPNVVGGYAWNSVNVNAVGAAIGGGGKEGGANAVNGDYGTVAGGVGNGAGAGRGAAVGGGEGNTASGQYATVAGGGTNNASGSASAICGGESNEATNTYATVAGGWDNAATGYASYAAGYRAKANHNGSFVWADYTAANFASTLANQFRVRANGGSEFIANNTVYGLRVENSGGGDGIRGYSTTSGSNWASVYAYNYGSGPGVYANTASGTYSGYFEDNIYVAGNCVGCTVVYLAVNGGDEPLEVGDLAAVDGVEGPLTGTLAPVLRLRRAGAGDTVVGVVQSRAAITTSEKEGQVLQNAAQAAGAAAQGEYLFVVVSGLAQVKANAGEGAIAVGQRLTAADQAGHARALRTGALDGMEVTEGAPLVGIALASLESGTGLIPVLVTLR